MHDIGNVGEAQEIQSWVYRQDIYFGCSVLPFRRKIPEGWKYVGMGVSRSVWLSPLGVAYKVEHPEDYETQNLGEIENLERAWKNDTPDGCRLPKFRSFRLRRDTVIAIEFIEGPALMNYWGSDRNDLYHLLRMCKQRYGLIDLHDENAIVEPGGSLVPIDFGY